MANLKQIRKHIASVQNTGKITKAMKMVAVSKLKKSQAAVLATRPYVSELIDVIEHLVMESDECAHPMLREPSNPKNATLIVVSGDKGLCGAYNHNIVKTAKRFIAERKDKYENIRLICVGCKAYEALRKDESITCELVEKGWEQPPAQLALDISKRISEEFVEEKLDEVFILYTKFKSAIAQEVILDAVLPLRSILNNVENIGDEENHKMTASYIYEPSAKAILDVLLPRAVSIHIQRSLLEGFASENGARMTAMDSASKNASDMIARLTLEYNHARQAAITTELIEVVSGAEAL